jgi:beta-phosphoglucomutase-like phosphatase (HAD superfamily)
VLTAALFELDGVLADVAATRAAALAAAFVAEGIRLDRPTLDAPEVPIDPAGWLTPFDDLATTVALGAADETTLALVALRAEDDYVARVAAGVTLVPGAPEAVAAISAEWRVGAVTGWRRADAERVLALAGLDAYVRFLSAADDGPPFAPFATRVRRAVERLRAPGAPAGTVAAVVASPPALAAARDVGARTVRVTSDVAPDHLPSVRLLRPIAVPADARLPSLRGLTPASLAAALDVAPRSPAPAPR